MKHDAPGTMLRAFGELLKDTKYSEFAENLRVEPKKYLTDRYDDFLQVFFDPYCDEKTSILLGSFFWHEGTGVWYCVDIQDEDSSFNVGLARCVIRAFERAEIGGM